MLKMFTTQLTGVFKRLAEKEEFSFEDGARLLAQAPVGDGSIYLFGTKEMKAVEFEALEGVEPLAAARVLTMSAVEELTDADRVLIFTRSNRDTEALELARLLHEKMIPFVAVSTVLDGVDLDLADLADVHLDLRLTKGLLPDDVGNRFGYPTALVALFVYYGLKFTIDEILVEFAE
ncbi:DUF2529 domain-containing protein [Neobacillus jeddahensis]|uniref:DUF2529 domain-containing protein n=1 Tax=Neobacillus jeddahensis TaxID=1461580 RepID=UPI00058BC4D2|nr:DUF2529 domain-containing protein [Neobacillus jeddahensis]